MQIKKSKLVLLSIIAGAIIVGGSIFGYVLYEQHKEKKQIEAFKEAIERAIDKEYKSLLWDYEYQAKQVLDSDYSTRTRYRGVRKINELLGRELYDCNPELQWDAVRWFEITHKEKRSEVEDLLRQVAVRKVAKSVGY